jgi:hypothetical protein
MRAALEAGRRPTRRKSGRAHPVTAGARIPIASETQSYEGAPSVTLHPAQITCVDK